MSGGSRTGWRCVLANGDGSISAAKVVDGLIKVATTLILFFATQTWFAVSELRTDVAAMKERVAAVTEKADGIGALDQRLRLIEGNRFTSSDALEMWKQLTEIKGRIPESFPSPETQAAISRIEKRMETIEKALRELEQRK